MKENKCYLYRITNLVNNKVYIGITNNPARRKDQHFNKRGYKWNSLVARAIDKYGKDNFIFEIICIGTREYICELEKKAIFAYQTLRPNGYNIQPGGEESLSGYKIDSRVNDKPIFVKDFWFPNLRTCSEKLNKDKTTILLWLKSGTASEITNHRKLEDGALGSSFCYVGGFWFPNIIVASASLAVDRKVVYKRLCAGYVEQQDNKTQRKGEKHPASISVWVNGVGYPSILQASKLTGYTYRVLQTRAAKDRNIFLP